MTSIKLLSISVVLLGISVSAACIIDFLQTRQIYTLEKKVKCLEFGLQYVGDEFCRSYEKK